MTDEELRSFVERATERLEASSSTSARNVQLRIVEPFLSVLGWDVRSTEVEAAWPADREDPFDYVLLVDGRPEIAVDVFGTETALEGPVVDRFEARLDAADLEWGLVSNGHRFAFLGRDRSGWKRRICRLDALPDLTALLQAYTRSRAGDRGARRRQAAARLKEKRSAIVYEIASLLEETAGERYDAFEALAGTVVDAAIRSLREGNRPRTTDGASPASPDDSTPDDASPSLDDSDDSSDFEWTGDQQGDSESSTGGLTEPTNDQQEGAGSESGPPRDSARASTDVPDGEQSADSAAPRTDRRSGRTRPSSESSDADSTTSSANSSTDDGSTTAPANPSADDGSTTAPANPSADDGSTTAPATTASESEYVVRFFGGSSTVGAVGHSTPAGALVSAFSYLARHRALTNRIDTPWGVDEGTTIVGRRPVHPDGTEMKSVHEAGDYFLWTGGSTDEYRRAIESLAELSGLRVMFQGDWEGAT